MSDGEEPWANEWEFASDHWHNSEAELYGCPKCNPYVAKKDSVKIDPVKPEPVKADAPPQIETETVDIRGRGHSPPWTDFEYELMLQSFVQNHDEEDKIPVPQDGKYAVSFTINGKSIPLKKVAEHIFNRYNEMSRARAAKIARKMVEEKIGTVTEKCDLINETLETMRNRLVDFSAETFPEAFGD